MSENFNWRPGQLAVKNRREKVKIDRVTPAGRAVVGRQTFYPDGIERTTFDHKSKLEPLTPEIQAELDRIEEGKRVSDGLRSLLNRAVVWRSNLFPAYYPGNKQPVPSSADVEKAERLVAAIREVLGSE